MFSLGKVLFPPESKEDSNGRQIIDKYQFNERLILVLDDLRLKFVKHVGANKNLNATILFKICLQTCNNF